MSHKQSKAHLSNKSNDSFLMQLRRVCLFKLKTATEPNQQLIVLNINYTY